MKYKASFVHILRNAYPQNFEQLLQEVDAEYLYISADTRFAATSANPIDRRLDFAAYFLALVRIMERRGEGYEQIRKICLDITYHYVTPKNNLQSWLKRLPANMITMPFIKPLINIFATKIGAKGHPDGFLAQVITDTELTYGLGYGFDILECGICKLFAKHQAGKYAAILCEVDKLTSALAGLELIRSGTIANGAAQCDFRFRKASTP